MVSRRHPLTSSSRPILLLRRGGLFFSLSSLFWQSNNSGHGHAALAFRADHPATTTRQRRFRPPQPFLWSSSTTAATTPFACRSRGKHGVRYHQKPPARSSITAGNDDDRGDRDRIHSSLVSWNPQRQTRGDHDKDDHSDHDSGDSGDDKNRNTANAEPPPPAAATEEKGRSSVPASSRKLRQQQPEEGPPSSFLKEVISDGLNALTIMVGVLLTCGLVLNLFGYGYTFRDPTGGSGERSHSSFRVDTIEHLRQQKQFELEYQRLGKQQRQRQQQQPRINDDSGGGSSSLESQPSSTVPEL